MAKRVVALGLLIAIGLIAGGANAASSHCPKVRHPLARGAQSVLWARGSDVVGCWRHLGRVRTVARGGIDFVPADAGHAVVAGHFAALALRTTGPVTDQLFVFVANLRTGRVHNAEANYLDSPAGMPTAADVVRLVLTPRGAAAWTTSAGHWPTGGYHVESMDPAGSVRVIDDEPGIDPRSLRLAKGRISWTAGGQRHTAPLR